MKTGLYKVDFRTPLGAGAGVVVIEDGKVRGGDSAIAYFGTYHLEQDNFTATVRTLRHTANPQLVNVFGHDDVEIRLAGKFTGDSADVQGSSPQAPGVTFGARLTRIAD